jgi:hypothetical protein
MEINLNISKTETAKYDMPKFLSLYHNFISFINKNKIFFKSIKSSFNN